MNYLNKITLRLTLLGLLFGSYQTANAKPRLITDLGANESRHLSPAARNLKTMLKKTCIFYPGKIYEDSVTGKLSIKSQAFGCDKEERKLIQTYQLLKLREFQILGQKINKGAK